MIYCKSAHNIIIIQVLYHACKHDFTLLLTIVGPNDCSVSTTAPPTVLSSQPASLELTEASAQVHAKVPTQSSFQLAGTECKTLLRILDAVYFNILYYYVTACSPLRAPINGNVSMHLIVAIFTCNAGYTLEGIPVRLCIGGQWTHEQPNCKGKQVYAYTCNNISFQFLCSYYMPHT